MTSPTGRGPVVPRRRLGAELRQLRERAGLKIEDVAADLECSVSKVSRLETGKGIPKLRDIRDLLDRYGVTDAVQRERLMRWGRDGRRQGWWHEYSDVLVAEVGQPFVHHYNRYVALEADASGVETFEPLVVHGLLQTAEYARAITGVLAEDAQQQTIDRLVAVRMRRQDRLYAAEDPLRLHLVLDEGALHRPVGTPEVMRRQLQRLLDDGARDGITIQVLPFHSGAHPAVAGSFVLLRFAESEDHDLVYIESHLGGLYLEKDEDVAAYGQLFQSLAQRALDPDQSTALIASIMRRH